MLHKQRCFHCLSFFRYTILACLERGVCLYVCMHENIQLRLMRGVSMSMCLSECVCRIQLYLYAMCNFENSILNLKKNHLFSPLSHSLFLPLYFSQFASGIRH